jgi:phosphatidylglycerol:prolipoprotein diacylglycerol transferase
MFPDLFSQQTATGTVEYHTWGLMLMIAFLVATLVAYFRTGKVGVNPDFLVPLLVLSIISALLGARLMHFLLATDSAAFFKNPLIFFDFSQGGMAVQGGVIIALLAGLAFAKVRGHPPLKLADVIAPSIALGQCIGRLGCFAAGCCHGTACPAPVKTGLTGGLFPGGEVVFTDGFPWIALVFKRGVGVGDIFDVPTYPTQLWESVAAFLLFLFLSWMWKKWRRFDGQILATYLMCYAVIRTVIELFRGDEIRGTDYFGVLSTGQLVSVLMFTAGVLLALYGLKMGKAPEEEYATPDDDDLAYEA